MNINLLFLYFRLGFEVKMNRFNKNTVLNQCHKKKQYEKGQNLLLFLKINFSYMVKAELINTDIKDLLCQHV